MALYSLSLLHLRRRRKELPTDEIVLFYSFLFFLLYPIGSNIVHVPYLE